ncbi:DNA-binding protein [Marisediminicola sp. LYQ134]|uniref:DNA-binding protein n=1 Tax=Marisediminicola sp. LYQ134 TaxID=3391061 RepID=UPI0039834ED6
MIVITADQRDSRSSSDAVPAALEIIERVGGTAIELTPERTAGDEIQTVVADGSAALAIALELVRTGRWSVGLGLGDIRSPVPPSVREATGAAFIAARDAVDRSKRSPTHCAVASDPPHEVAERIEALLDMLLILRHRRSAAGWEVADLVRNGVSQTDVAVILGISPQSVSQRARAANVKADAAATVAIASLLDEAVERLAQKGSEA